MEAAVSLCCTFQQLYHSRTGARTLPCALGKCQAICLEICQLPVAGADFHGKASKTAQTEYEVAEGKEGWYPFECRIKACAAGGVSWKRTERFNGDWMKKYYLKDCESAVW